MKLSKIKSTVLVIFTLLVVIFMLVYEPNPTFAEDKIGRAHV